jgi:hypothetical protein
MFRLSAVSTFESKFERGFIYRVYFFEQVSNDLHVPRDFMFTLHTNSKAKTTLWSIKAIFLSTKSSLFCLQTKMEKNEDLQTADKFDDRVSVLEN